LSNQMNLLLFVLPVFLLPSFANAADSLGTYDETSAQSNTVRISFFLRRIDDIDNPRGTVTIEIDLLHEYWDVNSRFNGTEKIYLNNVNDPNSSPRLQLSPVLKKETSLVSSSISPNGRIESRQMMTLTIRCDHKGSFPSDELMCDLKISSQHPDKFKLYWNEYEGESSHQKNSIQNPKVAAPFELSHQTRIRNKDLSYLNFEIGVRRRAAAYYWFTSIQPSLFLLVLTWLTLFLHRENFILLRISLALVSLIAVQALNFMMNSAGRPFEAGNVLHWWFQGQRHS
ncbi:hypothetical protein PMAYCL1PPCAC_12892, partial [Pristionchus mayeri]